MKPKTLFRILALLLVIIGTSELVCYIPLKDHPEAAECMKDIIILFSLALFLFIISLFIDELEVRSKESTYYPDEDDQNDVPQVSIEMCCDEDHAADFLRELANHLEARNDKNIYDEYETKHGYAEIKYK